MTTIAISLIREHTVKTKPPRVVFVPFPLGLPLGHPNDAVEQQAVLDLAFSTLDIRRAARFCSIITIRRQVQEDGSPIQANELEPDSDARSADLATEVTLMRRYWELHLAATGRTGVGLSKIRPQRFRGVVRFLEAYVAGPGADIAERPADIPVHVFVRLCVEDLRVMYAEARLQTHPNESSRERQRWMLGSTALSVMIRSLRDVMNASADPNVKAVAFGIGR